MIMLKQMTILFLIMMVGLYAGKTNIITEEASKKLSSLVVNIANPCFVVCSVLGDTHIAGEKLVLMALAAVGVYICLIVLAVFVPLLLKVPVNVRGTYKVMLVFNNIGFMGFPIVSGLYGSEMLLYVAVFMLPYNILIYTYGIYVMRKDGGENGKMNVSGLLNPGVIAVLAAFVIYIFQLHIPEVIAESITMISNVTAPLSMMVIGASFAGADFKKMFADGKLLVFSLLKLLVIPAAGYFLVRLWIHDPVMQGIILVMLGTPVGSMVAMIASEYGGDVELATKGVTLTSLLSVGTLSLLFVVLHI